MQGEVLDQVFRSAQPAVDEELKALVLDGLSRRPRSLPSKLLYDAQGSKLFGQICELPEYYLTRTELGIMRARGAEMAAALGPEAVLVEYGAGSGTKASLLLKRMRRPVAYMPIDISTDALLDTVDVLGRSMPDLTVLPMCADFTGTLQPLPHFSTARRTVVYFPGSTIGNFEEPDAVRLLRRIRLQTGSTGGALIGFDLKKDPAIIERAYNDSAGVTADFTLNLLHRLNRELQADFQPQFFRHRAVYREDAGRIETHIISGRDQNVQLAGTAVRFEEDEAMQVEISCKYSVEEFAALAARAGLRAQFTWTDEQEMFAVQYLIADA